jgi:hypothetical protein
VRRYCECFAASQHCGPLCKCACCYNTPVRHSGPGPSLPPVVLCPWGPHSSRAQSLHPVERPPTSRNQNACTHWHQRARQGGLHIRMAIECTVKSTWNSCALRLALSGVRFGAQRGGGSDTGAKPERLSAEDRDARFEAHQGVPLQEVGLQQEVRGPIDALRAAHRLWPCTAWCMAVWCSMLAGFPLPCCSMLAGFPLPCCSLASGIPTSMLFHG